MSAPKSLTAALAAAFLLQPIAAGAQQSCVTEDEVSAMAIYSVPTLVQAVRTRCGSELATGGYLGRNGANFAARYTRLQAAVWPRAKSGLIKYGARKARAGSQDLSLFTGLPDNAVRPLVDALILQEATTRVQPKYCGRIERLIQVMAPVDPEIAGTVLGVMIGLAAPEDQPICPVRRL